MPGPDPDGLSYDETPDGRPIVTAQVWPSDGFFAQGNRRHRLARARAVLMNLQRGGWTCPGCGDPVPIWRRADAVFCSAGCRKRAARARRKGREGVGESLEPSRAGPAGFTRDVR